MIIPLFLDADDKRFFPTDARGVITEICAATDMEVRKLLPMPLDEIELAVQTGIRVIPETGDTAVALSRSRIRWVVNPSLHGGLVSIARTQLRCTLFHELHHLARGWVMEDGNRGTSLIDAVVKRAIWKLDVSASGRPSMDRLSS